MKESSMEKLVIASIGKGAGKTSLIIGMAKALKRPFGYLKPFGDRLIYREKKVWDYDADLVMNLFGMRKDPEDLTIGFEHAKLRYMYDGEGRKKRLQEMVSQSPGDLLFVEGGQYLRYGVSLGLDPISVARDIGGQLIFLISGNEDVLMDDAIFVKNYLDMTGVAFKGIIFNKVHHPEEFKELYAKRIEEIGVRVFGIIPYEKELTLLSVDYLAKRLLAKVITGEKALNRTVRNILVGAMTLNALFQTSLFQKEDKLVITSGDREDMILAAIESSTAGVVITNNIVPSSNILSKAYERNIPLLLVSQDTYQAATQIDNIESLLTKDDACKIDLVERLIQKHVDLEAL
ncbi:MAG: phosphotransacetylase family protein, partial [Deltaproteobacteria bacterium]